jgi:hypothetical protein
MVSMTFGQFHRSSQKKAGGMASPRRVRQAAEIATYISSVLIAGLSVPKRTVAAGLLIPSQNVRP